MSFKVLSYAAGQAFTRLVPQRAAETVLRSIAVPYSRMAGKLEPLRDNLRAALAAQGAANEAQARRLSDENMKNFAGNLCELAYAARINEAFVREKVEIRGLERLDQALSKKKGVIIASAHIGNWELGGMVLSRLGYPLTVLVLGHRQKSVNETFQKKRRMNGIEVIFLGGGALRACYAVLKQNGILAMVGDLLFGKEGVEVNFLGRRILYPRGIARFSLATGAVILPSFFVLTSQNPRRYRLEIQQAIQGSSEEEITQDFAEKVEAKAKEAPEQWFRFSRFWELPECQN